MLLELLVLDTVIVSLNEFIFVSADKLALSIFVLLILCFQIAEFPIKFVELIFLLLNVLKSI